MEDVKIIELYFKRDETAIDETRSKYGSYCNSIAYRILENPQDADECENDTYLCAWNTMPPQKPDLLSTYLGMLCRNCALSKYRRYHAQKRGAGEASLSLCELDECIPDNKTIDNTLEEKELAAVLSAFLRALPEVECGIFIYRYWHLASIKEISEKFGYSQSKVKTTLYRTRLKLKSVLEREGIFV